MALMIAALIDLEVKPSDILNANAQLPVTDKVWTILCPDFNKDTGKMQWLIETYTV